MGFMTSRAFFNVASIGLGSDVVLDPAVKRVPRSSAARSPRSASDVLIDNRYGYHLLATNKLELFLRLKVISRGTRSIGEGDSPCVRLVTLHL